MRRKTVRSLQSTQINNHHYAIIINLIGGFNPSEKYESQLGFTIPNWMESHKIHVPKCQSHQPDIHVHPFSSFWTIQKTSKTSIDESHEIPVPPGFQPLLSGLCLDLSTTAQGHPARQGVLPKHQKGRPGFMDGNGNGWSEMGFLSTCNTIYIYIYMHIYIVDLPFSTTSCDFKATMCC